MGGNDWAAWAKPKAARKQFISGILKIKVPLILTFRAREKTRQEVDGNRKKVVNIGWQPVAPLEIVHTLDLACILPPRADGVPVWRSDKVGEDFVIKLPNYLKPFIEEGRALDEDVGAAFARWAKGSPPQAPAGAETVAPPASSPEGEASTLSLEDEAREAAKRGRAVFSVLWKRLSKRERERLSAIQSELGELMREADAETVHAE
jgi:hypothetical protein